MANLFAKAGQFTLNTTTGNQTITGLGAFTPKAIIVIVNDMTADGLANNASQGFGYATTLAAYSVSSWSSNAVSGSADTRHGYYPVLFSLTSATTTKLRVSLVSMSSGEFTINIDVTDGVARKVQFLALGGTDLSAYVTQQTSRTTVGSQALTGFGFQPEAMIGNQSRTAGAGGATLNRGGLNIGIADASSQYLIATESDDGGLTTDNRRQAAGDSTLMFVDTAGAVELKAARDTFDAGGITMDWLTVQATAYQYGLLALAGGEYKVGRFTSPTSTGAQSITGLGSFVPKAILVFSRNNVHDTTSYTHLVSMIGFTDTTDQYSIWMSDTDNEVDASNADQSLSSTKLISSRTQGTGAVRWEASLTGVSSGQFDLNWTTVQASGEEFYYIAFGDVSASEVIKTHTFDVATEKTTIKSHTFNTVTRIGRLKQHTFDTYLKKPAVKTHTFDTYLSKSWTQTTYYFDASDGLSDPDAVWSNDANAFDGSTATFATTTTTGNTSTNELIGEGTTAPGSNGSTIYQVRARMYAQSGGSAFGDDITNTNAEIWTDGKAEKLTTIQNQLGNVGPGWSSWYTLTEPTGGWTWQKLNDLEAHVYRRVISGNNNDVYRIELEVTHLAVTAVEKSHTFDTYLKKPTVKSHTFDTALKVFGRLKQHTFDVLKKKTTALSHSFDTYLKRSPVLSHTFDVLTKAPRILQHSFDTALKKTRITTHSFDVATKKFGRTASHTFDIFTLKTTIKSHTFDVVTRAGRSLSHTFDTLLKKTRPVSHTFDTVARKSKSVSHTFDTYLQASIGTTYFDEVMEDTPAAYWRLGEASGTVAEDDSGNNRDGTYYGSPTFGVTGAIAGSNTAVTFPSSTETVNIPDNAAFDAAGDFTFECFFRAGSADGMIAGKKDDGSNGWYIWLTPTGVLNAGFWGASGVADISSAATYTDDVWRHLVVVKSAAGAKMYVNAVEVASTGTNAGSCANTIDVRLALSHHSTPHPLNGTLDEVAIYDTVLSPARITAHYDARDSLGGEATIAHTFDTVTKKVRTIAHTFNTVTRIGRLASHTFDIVLRKATSASHSFDTFLKKSPVLQHTFDTLLKKPIVTSHTFDTVTKKLRQLEHSFDVATKKARTTLHTFDTILRKSSLISHTFDVTTKKAASLQHSFDTNLKKPFTLSHSFDTFTKKTRITSHTFDVALKTEGSLNHTFDVLTKKAAFVKTVSHTFDVYTLKFYDGPLAEPRTMIIRTQLPAASMTLDTQLPVREMIIRTRLTPATMVVDQLLPERTMIVKDRFDPVDMVL